MIWLSVYAGIVFGVVMLALISRDELGRKPVASPW
jgi:hypothetical protein